MVSKRLIRLDEILFVGKKLCHKMIEHFCMYIFRDWARGRDIVRIPRTRTYIVMHGSRWWISVVSPIITGHAITCTDSVTDRQIDVCTADGAI